MSSPEMEAFEITDEDLTGFGLNRNRGKWSKNHATYGVFLGDMVDSDDERPGLGKSGDRNGPINFISGGIKKETSNHEEEKDENICFDEDTQFKPKQTKFKVPRKDTSGFGNWEKHTKGIGWALISKMGYKHGQGLGKNEQGIKAPVEVYQRRGKGALGFYGSEIPEANKDNLKEVIAGEKTKIETKNWKKDPQREKKKGKKFQLKTIDDAIAEGSQRMHFKTDVKVKVIDMTGKEQRVLSGYGALAHKSEQEDIHTKSRGFDLPELKNNLNVLCDTIEDEIVSSDRKKRNNSDLLSNLEHEFDKKRILCEREEQFIEKLKDVLHIIDTAIDRSRDPMDPNTLKDCAIVAERLQDEYPNEYAAYDLGVFILALILPLFKAALSSWQPLIDPFREGVAMYANWKKILTEKGKNSESFMSPYERLVWDTWIPSVRTAITSHWNGRDVEALALLDRWQHNLPDWILNDVLDHLILPKLQNAVNEWDPLSDRIPIHNWLLQWSPMMGDKLSPLYEAIRHKFANALVAWHPSDPSAKFMLEPWNNVFLKGHMQAFLVRNVAPKLGQCLAEMDLSPNHLKLDLFNSVMTWIDLMPINSMVPLLERHFFPRWLQTLCHWLNQHPNYDEVSRWYMGWKNIFPRVLLEISAVRDQFNNALDFMNRAVSGEKVQPSPSYSIQKPPGKANQPKFSTSTASLSYKDIIGKRAEENDIVFLPVPNKTHESKQIYQFGRLFIYFDRNVLFVNEGGVWVPTSLNNLIDKAR
ncbi:unnamed protein product [Dimorphilus gyrociliatus]|uniref:G-patch domain-containing protein n=1 Tax=Dimorphilus gyrociliatus TaxID=2664684 RepID=A0A7I8V9D8_9ANNE|nr:unnamed protein product [Dimorphilus gyrociliatus]